jgi:hypothetical protein
MKLDHRFHETTLIGYCPSHWPHYLFGPWVPPKKEKSPAGTRGAKPFGRTTSY